MISCSFDGRQRRPPSTRHRLVVLKVSGSTFKDDEGATRMWEADGQADGEQSALSFSNTAAMVEALFE